MSMPLRSDPLRTAPPAVRLAALRARASGAQTPRPQAVLSVNSGSSTLKFALFPATDGLAAAPALWGRADGLEPAGRVRLELHAGTGQEHVQRVAARGGQSQYGAALEAVLQAIDDCGPWRLRAVAHRIVHGGERFDRSVRIDDEVLHELGALEPLAPLHQPYNLAGVRAFAKALPEVPQIGCFDTAFHAGTPELEQRFALPESLWLQGIRRYGFHGLSYRGASARLLEWTPRAAGRMVLAHLGAGASLCALRQGRSVATSMGFSSLDGLMTGTCSGSLDAGVLLHLLRQGMDVAAVERLLYRQAGLLGVSALSADLRTLRGSDSPAAARAVAMFTRGVVRECGALAACLGGVDLIGFTGGVGERDAQLREDVAAALAHLGARIDADANRSADGRGVVPVHAADSAVELWVVPTESGRVAAADALELTASPCQATAVVA